MGFSTSSDIKVKYPKLDIADRNSVKSFGEMMKREEGKVDVLINNAGVNVDDEYGPENVKLTLDTNVRGTLLVRSIVFSSSSLARPFVSLLLIWVAICRQRGEQCRFVMRLIFVLHYSLHNWQTSTLVFSNFSHFTQLLLDHEADKSIFIPLISKRTEKKW